MTGRVACSPGKLGEAGRTPPSPPPQSLRVWGPETPAVWAWGLGAVRESISGLQPQQSNTIFTIKLRLSQCSYEHALLYYYYFMGEGSLESTSP